MIALLHNYQPPSIFSFFSSFQSENLNPVSSNSLFPIPPAPGNHHSAYCFHHSFSEFDFSRYLMWMKSYTVFFCYWLVSLGTVFLKFIRFGRHDRFFFWKLNNIPMMCVPCFVYHSCCWVVNSATMNMVIIQILFWVPAFISLLSLSLPFSLSSPHLSLFLWC